MLSSELGGEGWPIMFVEPTFFEISGDEQQGARRSLVRRRRKPPLVWQGEMLYCHCRNAPMVEEGGQLDKRVVFGPSDDVFCGEVVFREKPLLL